MAMVSMSMSKWSIQLTTDLAPQAKITILFLFTQNTLLSSPKLPPFPLTAIGIIWRRQGQYRHTAVKCLVFLQRSNFDHLYKEKRK